MRHITSNFEIYYWFWGRCCNDRTLMECQYNDNKDENLHSAAKCNKHVFSTSTAEYNKIAVN